MTKLFRPIVLAAALTLLLPPIAEAWDAAGHMLVDEIAWQQMSVKARAQTTALVKDLDTRFHEGRAYNFVTSGCWMDDMRSLGRDYPWGPLHYVTIPWTESGAPAEIPPAPNIVAGIDDSVRILRDVASTPKQRTEALGMLTHFVGDIHQPLHATDRNGDRGGNGVFISGVPFSDLMSKQVKNLHTFWDKAFRFDGLGASIVEKWEAPPLADRPAPGMGIIAKEAKKIVARFPAAQLPELKTAGVADGAAWAKETHVAGCLNAYPPGEYDGQPQVRVLTAPFVKNAQEVANRRIAIAGYRLGALMNELFGK